MPDEKLTTDAPAPLTAPGHGPNGEKPNLRLAHTVAGSPERELFGEWYPALRYVRSGGVHHDLPCLPDGSPDEAAQRAGFWHEYAHRVARSPHYKPITEKG